MTDRMGPGGLLEQDKVWYGRNSDGSRGYTRYRLEEMTGTHLENLRSWLVSRAPALQAAELRSLENFASHLHGEQALYDLDLSISRISGQDPLEWLEEKPLYEAISRLLGSQTGEMS